MQKSTPAKKERSDVMYSTFHTGQRVRIKETDKEGIVFKIDPDMPYICNIRLNNGTYALQSAYKLESIEESDDNQHT